MGEKEPANTATNAIAVRNLTKIYGDQRAVDDLSFEIPWGRVTGFLGPNGAGKSTTLRMLLGLTAPTSGTALIEGKRFASADGPSALVGALLETQQFHPLRKARNHLRVYAAAAGIADSRVDEVLESVGLADAGRKKVGEFSLGMKQRLGLATALLGDPRILILDEPANGLDPAGIRWLRSFVAEFATRDRAVFLSSHLLGEIAQIAQEVVVIDRGRLIVHSDVEDLTAGTFGAIIVRTDEPERLRDSLTKRGLVSQLISHDTLSVTGATTEDVGRVAAGEGIALFGITQDERSLEEVFLKLTRSKEVI